MSAITEADGKRLFASLLLQHPGDPHRCAQILCARVGIIDQNVLINIAKNWPNDPAVIAEQNRVVEESGPESFLPSKYDLARLIWGIADSRAAEDDRLKAAKQYAELMGFIQKEGPQVVVVNKVMEVKNFGNDDDWEQKALQQQRKLIEHEA